MASSGSSAITVNRQFLMIGTLCLCAVVGLVAPVVLYFEKADTLRILLAAIVPWFIASIVAYQLYKREAKIRRALTSVIASYRDGEFNFSLAETDTSLTPLVKAHNHLGDTLREERIALAQRELMLDTVVQNTPVAILLIDSHDHIVLANVAARQMLHEGQRMEGMQLDHVLAETHSALRDAMDAGGDAVFSVGEADDEDVIQLTRRRFRINGTPHELLLLRQLTTELRRQEVRTWKNLIRIISHELNNSLAPIASLAHSSRILLERQQPEKLPQALETIEDRARHLEEFIRGYARFAKLPEPRRQGVEWQGIFDRLQSQIPFAWDRAHALAMVSVDVSQVEQALLNLLKNAHEAGGDSNDVAIELRRLPDAWRIDVLDRGQGMSDSVLSQALLPFYSTKRSGTGLGLALSREIAEAHGGRLSLANREDGGLCVSMILPG